MPSRDSSPEPPPAEEDRALLSQPPLVRRRRRWRKRRMLATVLIVAHVLGLLSSLHALMSVRTPQGTIAWIVSLNTLPVVSVPAYWIFGRSKFNGYVQAWQIHDEAVLTKIEAVERNLEPFLLELDADPGRIRAVERLARMPFLSGNDVELLIDGRETFDSILAGIAAAREYVLVQFYIVRDDGLGRELQRAMLDKAAEGVRVFFLYDEIGSHQLPRSYISELRAAGVHAHSFQTTRGSGNRFQLNFRNHRKIVVVDGHHGWVGGNNVGDEYLGLHPKLTPWRDTHLRLEGPSVLGLQVPFLEDWHWATDELLEVDWSPEGPSESDVPVLILPSGPADSRETAGLMFQHVIHSARERIWIASPYFVPDEGVSDALHLAALRGVDVKVLIPENPDQILVYLSAYAFVGKMLEAGIEIYRYQPGFLHQKTFLVDDVAAGIGTANLDNRSFRLNFEITALVADESFAAEVEQMFRDDFAVSRRMTLESLEAKSFWFRLAARAAYLMAPIQ